MGHFRPFPGPWSSTWAALMLDFWRSTGPLSTLDDGAVEDKARRRRAVLTMEQGQTRLGAAETDAFTEQEHERQRKQQRTCTRNSLVRYSYL